MTFLGFIITLVVSLIFLMAFFHITSGVVYFIVIIVEIAIFLVAMYNRIVMLKNKVEQSNKLIDIHLKQRFDLIPNLVEVVKGYKEYESTVLKEIISLRNSFQNLKSGSVSEEANLNKSFNNVLAVMEGYPELKANESFLTLQKQLIKMENQLQAARRIYNIDVTEYNTYILSFPQNIMANLFKFTQAELFEADYAERENVEVNIND